MNVYVELLIIKKTSCNHLVFGALSPLGHRVQRPLPRVPVVLGHAVQDVNEAPLPANLGDFPVVVVAARAGVVLPQLLGVARVDEGIDLVQFLHYLKVTSLKTLRNFYRV